MEKDTFYITRERLLKLGIDPKEAIDYLESKKAVDITPNQIRALSLLKESAVPSS